MNGKFALALILTLQVSMSLCQVPPPSEELVKTYEDLKSTFYSRLMEAYEKYSAMVPPKVQQELDHPKFQDAVKIAKGLAVDLDASPVVTKARMTALGTYEHYMRPYIGTYLADGITSIKSVLDKVLPAPE